MQGNGKQSIKHQRGPPGNLTPAAHTGVRETETQSGVFWKKLFNSLVFTMEHFGLGQIHR